MACWPHLLYSNDLSPQAVLSTVATNFEKVVLEMTDDHNDREKGFTYPRSFTIGRHIPSIALKLLAFRIRWDYDIQKDDYYIRPLPIYVQPGDVTAEDMFNEFVTWSSEDQEKLSQWEANFKSEVQDHLDQAVRMSSYVINGFARYWNLGDNPKNARNVVIITVTIILILGS